jgi:molybdopterin/thiamine biosynthesis adenylyltransferase
MSECLLFPAELLDAFDELSWSWGYLNLRIDEAQGVMTVAQARHENSDEVQRFDGHWSDTRHYLRYADVKPYTAAWYRSDPDLHVLHDQVRRRVDAAIPTEWFRGFIPSGWVNPGPESHLVVAVTTPAGGRPDVSVWRVNDQVAVPEASSIVDGRLRPLDIISDVWPTNELASCTATIVGVGSIGSAIADSLARSGVGHFYLIDHDRLEQRNLPRHRLTDRDLGRYKVDAMKDLLLTHDGAPSVDSHRLDVITDTDLLRPLVASSDIVVCAADGVAPRRVCNHIARRARTPLVLAAVLEDGAFGEIIRVRSRTGCLFCLRLQQDELGMVNPEPNIDLGYGTGTTHRPMTAAPGDLELVAQVAAKVTVATLLERRGRWNQRLPGDFAVVGLQPKPDYSAPFDIDFAGDVHWHPLPNSRPDCPTCTS